MHRVDAVVGGGVRSNSAATCAGSRSGAACGARRTSHTPSCTPSRTAPRCRRATVACAAVAPEADQGKAPRAAQHEVGVEAAAVEVRGGLRRCGPAQQFDRGTGRATRRRAPARARRRRRHGQQRRRDQTGGGDGGRGARRRPPRRTPGDGADADRSVAVDVAQVVHDVAAADLPQASTAKSVSALGAQRGHRGPAGEAAKAHHDAGQHRLPGGHRAQPAVDELRSPATTKKARESGLRSAVPSTPSAASPATQATETRRLRRPAPGG